MFVHVVSCSTEGKLMSPPCHLQDGSNRGRIVESYKMFNHCVSVMWNQKKIHPFHHPTKTVSEGAENTHLQWLFTLFLASVNTVHLDAGFSCGHQMAVLYYSGFGPWLYVFGCMCDAACPFVQAALHVCRILYFLLRNSFMFTFALCFKEMECHSWTLTKKMTALYLSHKVLRWSGQQVYSHSVFTLSVLRSSETTFVPEYRAEKSPSVRPDVRTASTSYCLVLQHFVESFADLGEVGPEGPARVVQFGQELGVGVMVEDVVDAAVGLGGEVGVDQLQ